MKISVLVIGPLPPPYGGTTVSFKHLTEALDAFSDVDTRIADTVGVRGHGIAGLGRFLSILKILLMEARRVDVVSLHCSSSALPSFGAIVFVLALCFRRPLIIRQFGGGDYNDLSGVRRWIARFVMSHADLCLLQTKRQMAKFSNRGISRIAWYPTSRPMDFGVVRRGAGAGRFVFVGHVNEFKGVREILAIDGQLNSSVSIDVYGPFTGAIGATDFSGCKHVQYCGVLQPDAVVQTLARYDALLLPTYYDGEGYPGVIIEAYAAGIPVVCTDWMALPELVDENSGIVIPPRDPTALLSAIERLRNDQAELALLREGVLNKRQEFSQQHWAAKFVEYCREVFARRKQGKQEERNEPN